jgi:hypothetical protein
MPPPEPMKDMELPEVEDRVALPPIDEPMEPILPIFPDVPILLVPVVTGLVTGAVCVRPPEPVFPAEEAENLRKASVSNCFS